MSVLAILIFCAVALMFGMVAGQAEDHNEEDDR